MEWLTAGLDIVLHLDRHLASLTAQYGVWVYAILFAIIFAETGLVVTPFLPGDSLLFIAGSLAALGSMNVHLMAVLLCLAAFAGNCVNYEIGRYCGANFFVDHQSRFLNPAYVARTHEFFERWGSIAVVMARFVPFLRTYVPFVAGMGAMARPMYYLYTLIGALAWVGMLVYLGYFFGNIPWIKNNQGLLVIAIVVISVLPVAFGLLKARFAKPKST